MPGLTGLEVAAARPRRARAQRIVFVTAYDQYAIDAFERGAIDYLLKPIKPERLDATIARLQAQGGTPCADAATLGLAARQARRAPDPAGAGSR
jgi:DNA-binding LytR/AlgR family response regulator